MRTTRRSLALAVLVLFAATGPASGQTRFAVFADNRDSAGFASVMERLKAVPGGPGELVLVAGDVDPAASTRAVLDRVFGASFPWYVAVGNHDAARAEDMALLRRQLGDRLGGAVSPGPAGARETVYSFDAGPVHITVINEFWDGQPGAGADNRADGDVVPELVTWLDADLARTTRPFKVVVGHEPAYPQPDQDLHDGRHLDSSLNKHQANRDAFWRALERRGVAVYICGHTHRYSRHRPEGSSVWQLDVGEARGDDKGWVYDTFVVATADASSLRFQVWRNLKERGRFEVTDSLTVTNAAPVPPRQAPVR
jgi:hypothetical protein